MKSCHTYPGGMICCLPLIFIKRILFVKFHCQIICNTTNIVISRRARENKGILQKLEKEKLLLRRELFDRLKRGQIIYKPKGEYMPVGFDSIPVNPT